MLLLTDSDPAHHGVCLLVSILILLKFALILQWLNSREFSAGKHYKVLRFMYMGKREFNVTDIIILAGV